MPCGSNLRRKRRSVSPLPIAETAIATHSRTSARLAKPIVSPELIRLKLLASGSTITCLTEEEEADCDRRPDAARRPGPPP